MRDKLQKEWKEKFCQQTTKKWILNLYQRTGKIKTSLDIIQELDLNKKKILISYPDNKIMNSWLTDIAKFNVKLSNITFVNTSSIKKYSDKIYDVYIFDECSDFSEAQQIHIQKIIDSSEYVIALSGTISSESASKLASMGLKTLIKYSGEDAIRDGLIADYSIEILTIPLSTIPNLTNSKGQKISEKKKFDNYTFVINKLRMDNKPTMFLNFARSRLLQGSIAKLNMVKTIIRESPEDRILIFTGLTSFADGIGIPSFHSKSKDKTTFQKFLDEEFNHLAVAKIGGSGVTYPQLDRVILTAFTYDEEDTSQIISRCMVLDYGGKVARITIICSDEELEMKKLRSTLADFKKDKIIWL